MKLNNCQFRVIYHKDFPMFRPTEIVYGKAEFIDKIEQAAAKTMTAANNKNISLFEAVEKIYAELLKFGFYDFNGDFDVCTLAGEEYPKRFYEKKCSHNENTFTGDNQHNNDINRLPPIFKKI